MRDKSRSLRIALLLGLVPIIAIGAALLVGSQAVEKGLRLSAETAARDWARYIGGHMRDLEEIALGAPPSQESLDVIRRARAAGSVFLVKIYGPDGTLRLSLDEHGRLREEKTSLMDHSPAAARAVARGDSVIEVKRADAAHRPAYYAEAFLPVVRNGVTVATAEVYVDQTEPYESITAMVRESAVLLSLIIGVASALPAFAFVRRNNAKVKAEERIAFLAEHDGLTGLLNRAGLIACKKEAFGADVSLALVSIGMNGFGAVNAGFGAEVGDKFLIEIAARLRKVAPGGALLARLDGAEFAYAFPARSVREAAGYAERALSELRQPFFAHDKAMRLTASAGLTIGDPEEDAGSPLARASIAMRRSKARGGDCLTIFDRRMSAEIRAGHDLESLLRQAVESGSFELYFQPFFGAGGHRLEGFEALLRMPNGEGGHIPPGDFIPLAERLGLICNIGRWSLRRACEVAAAWPDEITVAVNISPVQFERGDIVNLVREALEATGLAPHRLELEFTEGVLAADALEVTRQLQTLRELGVRLALDDFGTGFSSLSYLWKFPVDKLKIDRSFLRGMHNGEEGAASIICSIVALGRSLGLKVTGEGVETLEQMRFLTEVGCEELQGFYLGRPAPAGLAAAQVIRATHRRLAAPGRPSSQAPAAICDPVPAKALRNA
ncbi:putative bifunctional diguanylate cyclase/phosphodiesterase [Afifella pfennigii]|uniref:putative bifunctional diguanylate cyclase/phosphodiesterase n=1 Tax=Afifella pfennigii TaxID=209897 RepID=UPI00068F3EDD|nr:bifunctional diguanylate cyclase/phosphodiesterase [Afifella pfennigii]